MGSSISAVGGGWAGRFGQVDLQAIRRQRLDRLFSRADADGDGALSRAEFGDMHSRAAARMAGRGVAVGTRSADEAFLRADADGDGEIRRDEFASFLKSVRPSGPGGVGRAGGAQRARGQEPESESEETDPADADGDGTVTDAEYLAYYGVERDATAGSVMDILA
jgi:hypothetical protein